MANAVKRTVAPEADIIAIGVAGTACPGGLYLSEDSDKLWFGANDGRLLGPYVREADANADEWGDFPNDDAAGAGGVPYNDSYFLTFPNDYDLPGGLRKKRIERP